MIKNLLFSIVAFAISISLNAQAVWTQQNTAFTNLPTAIGVDQVSVVDANTVWVRGFNGSGAGSVLKVFSRTNNGGTTWTAGNFTQLAANEMPYVLGAVNYTTAFAVVMDTVSYATSLWGTTNGGTTWVKETTMFTNASSFANGVRFWDSQRGFCHGDPIDSKYEIYTTADGGDTWTLNATAPAPSSSSEYGFNGFDCMAVVPGGVGFIMTNMGRVLRTTDYGATWAATPNPAFTPSTAYGSNKIYASSANYIICAGFTTSTNTWAWKYTSDGGTTWNNYTPGAPFYEYTMTYVPGSPNMFVATSPYTTSAMGVAYSNNGGLTWADFTDPLLQPLGSNIQCLGVGFASMQTGWVGNYDQANSVNSILKFQDLTAGENILTVVNGNDINMYPNPSEGPVTFSINGPESTPATIKVHDVTGRLVFNSALQVNGQTTAAYDFSQNGSGLYIVTITSGNTIKTEKLIIR